jgi:membrane protease YdiL (CAAX protease family)
MCLPFFYANRIFFAFSVWAFFALMLFAVEYLITPDIFIWNFKLVPFTILVLISFILLPIQTSFEEILFRGYFMQGLGVLTKTRWFPLFFTSFLFGLAHISNPEIEKLGEIILIYYIGTGFLFAMTTLMDEGLEISLGMHAANNIITAVFVTADWSVFQTDALFIDSSEPNVSLEALIPVFVIYPIMLFIFSKKYHWKNWKEKLFGKI